MLTIAFRFIAFAAGLNLAAATTDIDREIVLAPHDGEAAQDREIARWQENARRPEANAGVFERLGWAYVAKARCTLDAGFYKLAEKTVDVIDAKFGVSVESRLLRGHVLHNVHRFRDAEAVARRLVAERGSPADCALLSDALIEQGKLIEGVAMLQRMVDTKPSTEAFSRIAHVRWLKGDLAGAIAAMETALQVSSIREGETQAWLLTRLSGFHLQRGDAAHALALAERASERSPSYPPALMAQGRSLIALGKAAEAIAPLKRAVELQPLPEYQWWLADVLTAMERHDEVVAVEAALNRRGAMEDPRTFVLFLATRGSDLPAAIRLARAELTERADVFSQDALAWTLAAAGELEASDQAMRAALAEGTRDARLFLHAGEIALARGEHTAAAGHFAAAQAAAGTLTPSERALLARRIPASASVAAR